jgi:hypothetical protein
MPDGSSGPKWTAVFAKVVAELGESDHATADIGGRAMAYVAAKQGKS